MVGTDHLCMGARLTCRRSDERRLKAGRGMPAVVTGWVNE